MTPPAAGGGQLIPAAPTTRSYLDWRCAASLTCTGPGQDRCPRRPCHAEARAQHAAHAAAGRHRRRDTRRADRAGRLRRKPTATEIAAGADPDSPIDDGVPVLRVSRALAELNSGQRALKGPKSAAGRRTVALPAAILPEIREHLRSYAEAGSDGRLFIGPKGASPRRSAFNKIWKKAARTAGANPLLHLHDLRHTGGTLAAQTGATLREVMSRIGHGSARAALIYQHATSERDHRIAEALDLMIREARAAGEEAAS